MRYYLLWFCLIIWGSICVRVSLVHKVCNYHSHNSNMTTLLLRLLVSLFFVSFLTWSYFFTPSRFFNLKSLISNSVNSSFSSLTGQFLLFSLFRYFLLSNILGNIPINTIPTLFYSSTFTVRICYWSAIITCVSFTQLKSFLAHMLPYGSPVALILFLPLVEIFSQLIRPLTLIIRLRTNLSSGHIIIYMFSYFTILSSLLSPFIYTVLFILFFLELAISALQAYIFESFGLCIHEVT